MTLLLLGRKRSGDRDQNICFPRDSLESPALTSTLFQWAPTRCSPWPGRPRSQNPESLSMFSQIFLEFERGLDLSLKWRPTYFSFIPNSSVSPTGTLHSKLCIYKAFSLADCPSASHRPSFPCSFSKSLRTLKGSRTVQSFALMPVCTKPR